MYLDTVVRWSYIRVEPLGVVAGRLVPVQRVGDLDLALTVPPDQEVLGLTADLDSQATSREPSSIRFRISRGV